MKSNVRGFSAIELLIVVVIIAIVAGIAYPSYKTYIVRTSREAAEAQLQRLANLQEKIYLTSSAYTALVTNTYTGASTGGLGLTSGQTIDNKYNITAAADASTFTLTATPVAGTSQVGDGTITIDEKGVRLWNGASW